jgi:uncharacterized protein YhbP (UPF0306 family)
MDINARIKEVLARTFTMSLGTHDERGVWVADVTFVYDEECNIYWMSHPLTRHSQAIEKNNKVAATVTATASASEKGFGVQMDGVVEKVETTAELIRKLCTKKNQPLPAEGEDFMKGRQWYMLRPGYLGLIDEVNFGFKRQDRVG